MTVLDIILSSIKELGISDYLLREVAKESAELFFIKKQLDMRRICDTVEYELTVYNDFTFNGTKMRGSSSITVHPGTDRDELKNAISDAYNAAQYVNNPFFELYAGKKEDIVTVPSRLASMSLNEIAAEFSDALFSADVRSDAIINSAEVFAARTKVRIISSAGSDVGYIESSCTGEFIVQCKEPKDVEQYFEFDYSDLDTDQLAAKAAEALSYVCDRAKAEKSPESGEYDIILTGDNVRTLFDLYMTRGNVSAVFARYSDYVIGKKLQGDNIQGEGLNVTLIPSSPYSVDGVPMVERSFISGGELKCLHGAARFCRYLGMEPVGAYTSIRLENGTVPFEEMKKGCLYPVSFSDFQMDVMDGHFKGEIRLAYYYGENGVEVLSGGSINGSLLERHDNIQFSLERYRSAQYDGPLAIKIHGVSVAG